MAELKRQFKRRLITWRVRNFTSLVASRFTDDQKIVLPEFDVFIGKIKTQWTIHLEPCHDVRGKNFVGIVFQKVGLDSADVSLTFTASIRTNEGKFRNVSSLTRKYESSTLVAEPHRLKLISHDELFNKENKFLGNRVLTIAIEFELLEESKVKPLLETLRITENYEKLLNDKELSDFVFICSDGQHIHVTMGVILIQCPSFALKFNQNESGWAEFDDIDSKTMLELLRFIYCGKVEGLKYVDFDLLIAAHKYGMSDLKEVCVSSLMETFPTVGFFKVLELADLMNLSDLKANIIDHIKCKYNRIRNSDVWNKMKKKLMKEILDSFADAPSKITFESDARALLFALVLPA